jgi:hypothetical protein
MIGVIILLLIIILSGCQEKSSDNGNTSQGNPTNNTNSSNNSKFIGDWKSVGSYPDYETWSYYTNGTAKNLLIQQIDNQPLTTISWFNYTINNATICLSSEGQSECLKYNFTNNTTHLTLSFNDVIVQDLVKIT